MTFNLSSINIGSWSYHFIFICLEITEILMAYIQLLVNLGVKMVASVSMETVRATLDGLEKIVKKVFY